MLKHGTRVIVTLPNGEEAAARFCSQTGDEACIELFEEHHRSATDKGIRIVPMSSIDVDNGYSAALSAMVQP